MQNQNATCANINKAGLIENRSQKKIAKLRYILLAFVVLFVVTPARADESSPPSNAPTSVSELERRLDVLADQLEKFEIGRAYAKADQSQYGMGPAASKIYRATPGVTLGGYGELESVFNLENSNDYIDLYRVILYAGYKFNDQWVFNSEIEFEHVDELSVEFAYIDYLAWPEFSMRAGHMLVPMGIINELHEPTTFLSVQRPEVERRILPSTWHENGIGVFGEAASISYKVYLINGFDASKFKPQNNGLREIRQAGSKAKFAKPAGVVRLDYNGLQGFNLGASVYAGDSFQGSAIKSLISIYEGHVDWRYKGIRARVLSSFAKVNNADDLNQQLGYIAAGESVPASMYGHYAEIGYNVLNALRLDNDEQTLTPFVRLSLLDTTKSVPAGKARNPKNEKTIVETGMAYQPIDQIIIKLNYRHADSAAGSADKILETGLGWIF